MRNRIKDRLKDSKGVSFLHVILVVVTAVLAAVILITGVGFVIHFISGNKSLHVLEAAQVNKKDVVRLGRFEQDGDEENGPEEIEWIVLDVQPMEDENTQTEPDMEKDTQEDAGASEDFESGAGTKVLLISRNVLQAIPLHNVYEDITWDDCTLRAWLNDEFVKDAFTKEEKEHILTSKNENNANPALETHGCGVTEDQAFILSLEEAKAYLRTDEDYALIGAADGTEYAKIKHLEVGEENTEDAKKACWWLRTPGVYQYSAAFVDRDGTIFENGAIANHETYCGVRPVVWVEISPAG